MAWFGLVCVLVWSCLDLGLVFSVSGFGLVVVVHGSWIDPSLGQNY